MKKFNLIVMFAVLVVSSVLADSDIDTVKKSTLFRLDSLTVGDALNNYKYFKTKKWKLIKTSNGKRIVEFCASYKADNLFKHTEYKELKLIIKFTMRASNVFVIGGDLRNHKLFKISYFGTVSTLKNGKIEQKDSTSLTAQGMRTIYEDQNIIDLIAPLLIAYKARQYKSTKGKSIGEILDNYKYFSSVKWEMAGNSKNATFTGIIKPDKLSRKLGIKAQKLACFFINNKYSMQPADNHKKLCYIKEYSENEKKVILVNSEKTLKDIIQKLGNNENIYNVFNPAEIFKNSKQYKRLTRLDFLKSKKVARGKDMETVIFSGSYPLSEMLKLTGIVERKVFAEYKMKGNISFSPENGFVEDKYKDGTIKRFDIPVHVAISNNISLYLDPIYMLKKSDCEQIFKEFVKDFYNEYYRKFLGGKSGRLFFAFIKYDDRSHYDPSKMKNYCYFYELIAITSFDVNGKNPKFEKVAIRLHNGKIIHCATDYKKKNKLPTPFYYINRDKNFPKEWLGKDYALVKHGYRRFPEESIEKLVNDCKKKNQDLKAFKTIFPLEKINTVSQPEKD